MSSRSPKYRQPRGRTRKGRLRLLDAWLLRAEPALCHDSEALFVDVGVGARPDTLVDWCSALRQAGCAGAVVGVELVPERVLAANALAPELEVREGGLELPLNEGERPSVVRCMNVLRGGPLQPDAHARLARRLRERGVLIEGSSDDAGGLLVAHVLRQVGGEPRRERLLFLTDFSRGFAPLLFRDWLPRDLRREWGGVLRGFFAEWNAAFNAVQSHEKDPATRFVEAAGVLNARGGAVALWCDLPGGAAAMTWAPRCGVPSAPP